MILPRPQGTPRRGDWMQSYRGGAFYPNDPQAHEVFIEDIAHSLSMICRYGGQCDRHYSVAEHSYWLSYMAQDEFAALMHDAPECYLGDIPTPLKKLLRPVFDTLEREWWKVIAKRFGLPLELPADVMQADADICLSERDGDMKPPPGPWRLKECGFRIRIRCWSARRAEKMFLRRFRELCDEPLSLWDRLQLATNRLTYLDFENNKKLQKETSNATDRNRRQGALGQGHDSEVPGGAARVRA